MFRNLIVPCARRSQGEKSNWMRSCLLAVGSSQAWHPGALCYCSEVLEILSEPDQIPPPPGRPSDPPSRVHFCFFRTLSSLLGHVLWHLSFFPLQEVCLYCCLIFPANLWAPKDRGRDCLISVRSLEENRMVLSVCEGVAAIPSVPRPHFAPTSIRIFIHREAVISFCAFLPSTREFLADKRICTTHFGNPTDQNVIWVIQDIC